MNRSLYNHMPVIENDIVKNNLREVFPVLVSFKVDKSTINDYQEKTIRGTASGSNGGDHG